MLKTNCGSRVESGECLDDPKAAGDLTLNICRNNTARYFRLEDES